MRHLWLLAWLVACGDPVVPCIGDPEAGDADGDGWCDDVDACPDPLGDSDGDGVCDHLDPCPLDAPPHDDDGDGVCDTWDLCVGHDASGDTDGDGICDDTDPCFGTGPDADGDGMCDDEDPCPADAADDSDGDGSCDSADLCLGDDGTGDSDGDGLCDHLDPCPFDVPPHDDDGDGVCDTWDFCIGHDASGDDDLDGTCDDLDPCYGTGPDTDDDGVCDDEDPCPADPADDSDGDGSCDSDDLCLGDDRSGDGDDDGVCDHIDDCEGDDASGDSDGDGLCDDVDVCLGLSQIDTDGDGLCDERDVCPETPTLPGVCSEAPEGLAHYWPGDGHMRDVVGGADAVAIDNVTVDLPGVAHRGFSLTVPTTSRLVLPAAVLDGVTDFTVGLWFRSSDVGYGLFSAAGSGSANAFLLFVNPSSLQVHFGTSTSFALPVTDMLWHHVAVTRDGTSGAARLYLDGAFVAEWTVATGPIPVSAILLGQDQDTLGGGGLDPNQAMQGRVDEIALYHRVLDGGEVALLASPVGICDPGTGTRAGGDDPLCPITWHVDPEALGSGDGRSFDGAFATLDEAASAAGVGDSVWVLEGQLVAVDVAPSSDTSWYGGFAGHETAADDRDPDARTTLDVTGGGFTASGWTWIDGFDFRPDPSAGRAITSSTGDTLVVDSCSFEAFSGVDGGAVHANHVRIARSVFTDNVATDLGGALYVNGRLVLVDSTFDGNSAGDGGAVALSVAAPFPEVVGSVFVDNAASDDGGAIKSASTRTLTVKDSWFEGGTAVGEGGAVYSGPLAVEGSTFVDNVAATGSALFGSAAVDVTSSRFHANGGRTVHAIGLLRVANSEFVDHAGTYVAGSSTQSCQSWSNTYTGNAPTSGGFFGCALGMTLYQDVFVGNTPEAHGATCDTCCTPGGTVDSGASTLERLDLDDDGLDEVYLPTTSPCRESGSVEVANDAPLLADSWWQSLTTTADQSLDADPPDFGRHYRPIP